MQIKLGVSKFTNKEGKRDPVIIDYTKTINGHTAIIGGSGTGKTYRLRKMVDVLKQSDVKIYILDVHGDIDIDGAEYIKISESSGNGLNPLKISADKDSGGVRKRISSFISMLQRTSTKLGSKQISALSNTMKDLYAANGFYENDPRTWSLDYDPYRNRKFKKKQPTVLDLKRFTERKLKQMISGGSAKAITALENLNKKYTSLGRYNNKMSEIDEEKIAKLKAECIELYTKYIESIETGGEIDELIKYDSKDVMKSIYERIANLEASGIFKDNFPVFEKSDKKIFRIDIKSLNVDEQKMFVDVFLAEVFEQAKERGEVPHPDTFIILDEAHIFLSDDSSHITNVIAKEARKFGIASILSSQSFTHFPEDIIANTSVKIILGIDEMYHQASAKKLMIEPKRFGYIVPHKSALVQVKNKGDMSNKFVDVFLQ